MYSAAKAGVVNFTRSAATELARERIRVNAICPGGILTPLVSRGASPEVVGKMMDQMQPWPEHGTGEHIAGAALFLASDDSTFVTGDALVVDGGLEAAGPNLGRGREQQGPRRAGVDRGNTGQPSTIDLTLGGGSSD